MGEQETLGAWLQARVTARGMSLRQLALYSGISYGTLRRMLTGKGEPRPEVVAELARFFGEAPEVGLAALARSALAGLDAPPEARAEAVALLQRLYGLEPVDRQLILRHLTALLSFLERDPSARGAGRRRARGAPTRGAPTRGASRAT